MIRARLAALLPKSTFTRNVSIISGGTLAGQAILALSLPVLTRLYTPADFDLLAVYIAILGLATVASCLRLNIAVMLPEHDEEAINLVAVALLSAATISGVMAILVAGIPDQLTELLKQPDFTPYLWMIPVGVLLASAYSVLDYWAARKRRFPAIAWTRVSRAGGGAGTQLAFGLVNPTPFGLIFGHMILSCMGVWRHLRSMLRHDRLLFGAVSVASMRAGLGVYRRFPIYSVPEALFNTAGSQLPILLIAALAIGPEAGFLILAMRVLGMPMGLVGSSVSQVYIAEAPKRLAEGTLGAFTARVMWTLFKTGGLLLILAGAVSPFLFPVIFGQEWARAGVIVAWLTPWFVLQFVTSPVSLILHVTGQLFAAMLLQLVGLLIRFGAVLAAAWLAEEHMVEAFALSGAVFYGIYIWLVLAIVKVRPKAGVEQRADSTCSGS